jgi:fructokinase
MLRIGIDLGGTKIEGVLLDEQGQEIRRERVPTERQRGYEAILGTLRDLYFDLVRHTGGKAHSLGIGTPGALSVRSGLLKNSNTTCMNGRPVRKDLEKLLSRTFEMQNDANCFALAEAVRGAAQGKRVVFGVIIGTGCGGGLIIDGAIHEGLQHIGGEWGHSVIDPAGVECYCGNRGCVETFISGAGLERRWQADFGEAKAMPAILDAYRQGEADAAVFMKEFYMRFGRAIANLINTLDPDAIVLGGGVSNVHELYTDGVEEVRKRVFSDSLETPILRHQLGDSAGVIGAALIGK